MGSWEWKVTQINGKEDKVGDMKGKDFTIGHKSNVPSEKIECDSCHKNSYAVWNLSSIIFCF